MSEELSVKLSEAITCKSPKEAAEKFSNLVKCLGQCSSSDLISHLTTIINTISQDMVTVISARKFCEELTTFINEISDDNLAINAFHLLLSKMQPRNIAFEVQLVELRDLLAKRLVAVENLREAATTLAEMPLESGQRAYGVNYKIEIYLRISECYLKLHDLQEAEGFINRASLLQPECDDQQLLVRYKIVYANFLNLKQRFLEAGQRFAELAVRFPSMEDCERLSFLERALAAALLSGAGHQRARLLATLYKDERCQAFDAYPILENMYMGRLINRSSLKNLEPLLNKYYPYLLNNSNESNKMDQCTLNSSTDNAPVQKLYERALTEHNMLASSLIYNNISLENLGCLLEISASEAESIAAQMISESRLSGKLDQIDGVIHFESNHPSLSAWSVHVQSLCHSVNRIFEDIEAAHPEWVATYMNSHMCVD